MIFYYLQNENKAHYTGWPNKAAVARKNCLIKDANYITFVLFLQMECEGKGYKLCI